MRLTDLRVPCATALTVVSLVATLVVAPSCTCSKKGGAPQAQRPAGPGAPSTPSGPVSPASPARFPPSVMESLQDPELHPLPGVPPAQIYSSRRPLGTPPPPPPSAPRVGTTREELLRYLGPCVQRVKITQALGDQPSVEVLQAPYGPCRDKLGANQYRLVDGKVEAMAP